LEEPNSEQKALQLHLINVSPSRSPGDVLLITTSNRTFLCLLEDVEGHVPSTSLFEASGVSDFSSSSSAEY
jgi:hypothetical protein